MLYSEFRDLSPPVFSLFDKFFISVLFCFNSLRGAFCVCVCLHSVHQLRIIKVVGLVFLLIFSDHLFLFGTNTANRVCSETALSLALASVRMVHICSRTGQFLPLLNASSFLLSIPFDRR